MSDKIQKNVFGEPLELCSNDPITGWFRDGCCNTDKNDKGFHTVCAKVSDKFLIWSKQAGNDLITPHPEFGFPGLKEGDSWCVCATWYARALEEDVACPIYLKGLNIKPNHNGINEYLGELYVQTNRIDKANERLAVLKNCGCKEYSELELIIKTRGVKVY